MLPTTYFLGDSLFNHLDSFFNDPFFKNTSVGGLPKIHCESDEQNLYIKAVVAGLDKDKLKVSIDRDILQFVYTKPPANKEEENRNVIFSEVKFSSFVRKIRIPTDILDVDKIVSETKDGILNIVIPFQEKSKPKLIDIKV